MNKRIIELGQKLKELRFRSSGLRQSIRTIDEILLNTQKSKQDLEKQIVECEATANAVEEELIIESGLPDAVTKLRQKLTETIRRSGLDTITIARKKEYEKEIEELTSRLRNVCPHTFLLDYKGYEGDPINEWENARFGHRTCLICGHSEQSRSKREEIYTSLTENKDRLIKGDLRKNPSREWLPMSYINEAFRRSAGKVLVLWPVTEGDLVTDKSDCYFACK